MSEKETKVNMDPFEDNSVVKSDTWSWREIHLQFIIFSAPLPLFFIITGIFKYYDCDIIFAIWMVVMGLLMQLELVYISIYFQRMSVEANTELDIDDAIFGEFDGQKLKDPILRKVMKLHLKIGFLAYFGIAKCYLVVYWSSWCSGFIFWPSLFISLFYCISLVAFVCFTTYRSKTQKNQNMIA